MTIVIIDNIGTTLDCTDDHARNLTQLRAALIFAKHALTPAATLDGPLHQAYTQANRAYTAALAAAGDPMAQFL